MAKWPAEQVSCTLTRDDVYRNRAIGTGVSIETMQEWDKKLMEREAAPLPVNTRRTSASAIMLVGKAGRPNSAGARRPRTLRTTRIPPRITTTTTRPRTLAKMIQLGTVGRGHKLYRGGAPLSEARGATPATQVPGGMVHLGGILHLQGLIGGSE